MITILLLTKVRVAKNKFFSYRYHSRLKGAVIGLFLLSYLLGGYFFLHEGFQFILRFPFVGALLLDRVVELFFFALFVMLTTSHALFAYGAYFRSEETTFLRLLPIPLATLFAWEFWESIVLSSWTFLFVSIPMLIAYAQVRHIFASFVGLFLLLFLPLVILSGVFGTFSIFFMVKVWRSKGRWVWLAGAAGIALALGLVTFSLRSTPTVQPVMNQILDKLLWHTRFANWPCWPSQWVSRSLLSFIGGEFNRGLGYLWFGWISALFFVQILFYVGPSILHD